jgi:tetratricopeptide (TPR) repeat protein
LTLIGSLIASFFVLRRVESLYPAASMEDVLFMPSPEFVKRASLGYSGLLADIYWMRVVQYFGSKHLRDSMQYKSLAPLLDITTTLDPHLIVAYEWGSTFLEQPPPSGAGDIDASIRLIRKGIQNNPQNWHLYLTLGFVQYQAQHDYLAAANTFEEGSKVPNANPALKAMAAKMLMDAGSLDTASYMWQSLYNESNDKDIRRNAELHLACLLVDRQVPILESSVDSFRKRFGRNPNSWTEMSSTGVLRMVPRDPTGQPYLLRDGRVIVSDPKKLPFIREGKPA